MVNRSSRQKKSETDERALTIKQRVFVGSSVEGLEVAYAVQENLEYDFEVTVWPQGVFEPSKVTIEALDEHSRRFDAAIFVFSPDDIAVIRGRESSAVRDNVVFELGLFIGRLGRDKCFILQPRSSGDFRMPTDLLAVNPATYDGKRNDGNWVAALGPACNKIKHILNPNAAGAPKLLPERPDPASMSELLTSGVFRLFYNPPSYSKKVVFASNGQIIEGNNQNEHSWRIVKGKLELVQLDGTVHSRFYYDAVDGTFKHTNEPDTLSIRNQFIVPDRSS
jgi:predicted nucleotide-binding protein